MVIKLVKPQYTLNPKFISKDIEAAKKEKFNKIIRRQLPFAMDGYMYASLAVKKRWGIDFVFYAGGKSQVKTILYPIVSLHEKPAELWWEMMNKDLNFSQSLIDELKGIIEMEKKLAASIPQGELSLEEVEKYMLKHLEFWIDFFVLGFLWFCVEVIKEKIDEQIKKEWTGERKELEKFLEEVYRPMHFPTQSIEQRDLLKLSQLNGKELENALKEHIEKYQHLALYNIDDECFDKDYYLGRIKILRNSEEYQKQKNALDFADKELINATNLLKNAKISNILKDRINFVRWFMFLRTNSVDYMMLLQRKYKTVFKSMSEKFDLPMDALLHMTYDELINSARNKKLIVSKETVLNRTKDGCAYMIAPNASYLISGKELDELERLILPKSDNIKVAQLNGQIAFKGKVSGKVRVILDRRQANDLQEGEILVTTMTTPDFVPAMKRSLGIITNEGGILCHAAIMSRELRKPCVIGTKSATDVLKNGDIVELDADKGIVRIQGKT